jgi:trypsin
MPSFMSSTSRLDPAEIVGGQLAPSPIPWQAAIQHGESFICGATILDAFSVLSAAHCFYEKKFSDGLSIRAGSIEKSNGGQVCKISHL